MEKLTAFLGNIAALVGVLACVVAGGVRVLGHYQVFDISSTALFQAGVGLMVLACLCKLHVLSIRSR
ncbi:MAG: hypothetical protein WBO06_14325 [Gammaproteobacteria bacterium]